MCFSLQVPRYLPTTKTYRLFFSTLPNLGLALMSKSLANSSFAGFSKSFRRKGICKCASSLASRTDSLQAAKAFATSSSYRDDSQQYSNRGRELREGPRWASTPPRMMAPVRSKPPIPNNDFEVNTDPVRLDNAYNRVLGKGGDTMLTEEVKWLAVTHKSFDHGRRGYNDRLAYLGMRAMAINEIGSLADK